MVTAELNHNPYLLETNVILNGKPPRINSQLEKYEHIMLNDWAEKVPEIFHDEMNGYDFDLLFTGTKADFESLVEAFRNYGVSEDMVRLFHKNELEDPETKSCLIDELIEWLKRNPNRKFSFSEFYETNAELFDGSYPYVIINCHTDDFVHLQVKPETVKDVFELENTVLINTPILFFVDPESIKSLNKNLLYILKRKDLKQNQLFFMIHPRLDVEYVRRTIVDLGVEQPQIVSSCNAESIIKYLQNYPITEFVREAIKIFRKTVDEISEVLDAENKESEIQNAEIHGLINSIEQQISLLKRTDIYFVERDNLNVGYEFFDFKNALGDRIKSWRNRKTKVNSDEECNKAARDYSYDIEKYLSAFEVAVKTEYAKKAKEIYYEFKNQYKKQGLDIDYQPGNVVLRDSLKMQSVSVFDELISMKVITFEDRRDLVALLRKNDEKEQVRVVTCYFADWRSKAIELIIPIAEEYIEKYIEQLVEYYNTLAENYHDHITILLASQEANKDKVLSQLSDDERKLQEDNDWFAIFKDKLEHIERG